MFYRGLAILLCSCLIAGSLPQSAVAKEPVQTETAGAEFVSLNEEGEEEKKDTVSLRLTCVQAPVGAVSSAPDSVTGPTAPLSISEGT